MTRPQQKRNNRLRNARRAAGLTQEQLAERIGVSEKTVQRWEVGKAIPQPIALHALCEELHAKNSEELGFGDTEEAPSEEEEQPVLQQTEQCQEKQRQRSSPLQVPLMKRSSPLPRQRNFHLLVGLTTILVVAILVSGGVMVAFPHLPILGQSIMNPSESDCGQPFSGAFHRQLDTRWQFVNPTEDGTWHIDPQGSLSITAPRGSDLNPNPGHNLEAPRLLQPIRDNFTIQTRLQFSPTRNFQSAGLLLWQDSTTFLRFERVYGLQNGILFQQEKDNDPIFSIPQSRNHLTSTQSLDLRVQKQGDHFTAFWRELGHNWQKDGETDLHFDHLTVGFDVLTVYGAPPITATFTSFTVNCA
ncbi:MAG TPA: helix-turn-helix domain-containing protein [Ktedonobacteraceae bacterium]|nr:helix-turn-helix domain-containing protein [Ktedonobacteraceae bacterium]